MSFGVTEDGFKAKTLAEVGSETTDDYQGEFGDGIDLDPRSPFGQQKNILDDRIASLWELAEAVYYANFPNLAQGVGLDNVVGITGITREAARKSRIFAGRARGTFNTVIPAGFTVSVQGDSTKVFETDEDYLISEAAIDEVQDISYSSVPDSGSFKIILNAETTAAIPFSATNTDVQTALEALSGVGAGDVVVTGDFSSGFVLSFANALGGQPLDLISITDNLLLDGVTGVAATPDTVTDGDFPKTELMTLFATEFGPIDVAIDALNVIETPVLGVDSFTNEEGPVVGRLTESDAELRLRREAELQVAGSATIDAIRVDVLGVEGVTAVVVFDNRLAIPDIEGRPPKSVDIVVQGGVESEIASAIFSTVAAGIEMIGDILESVIDSQGFSHDVRFSRPTLVEIHYEADLTIDADLFPADGAAQIVDLILAYGEALTIGQDIIVFGSNGISCVLNDIPGILDYTIRISRDAGPPLTDDNIIIAPRELAEFDVSRIGITTI